MGVYAYCNVFNQNWLGCDGRATSREIVVYLCLISIIYILQLPSMQGEEDQPNYQAAALLIKQLMGLPASPLKNINNEIIECLKAQPIDPVLKQTDRPLQSKLKQMLSSKFTDYNYKPSRDFLCAQFFPPGPTKHEVFTCRDCRKESNSIFCSNCFDLSKHKGHKYESQKIKGGVCDCGDRTKWNEDTFCDKHSFEQEQKEGVLGKDKQNELKLVIMHLVQVLCRFHEHFLAFRSLNVLKVKEDKLEAKTVLISKGLRAISDIFGSILLEQLISINKNRLKINRLTIEALTTTLLSLTTLPQSSKLLIAPAQKVPLSKMLLTFIELPKTSGKCVELILLLLYKDEELRKEMTIDFIKAYSLIPGIAVSNYRDLSPQLFSNSLLVSQLVKDGQIPKFALQDDREWPSEGYESLNNRAIEVNSRHSYFNTDLAYFVDLLPECAVRYWERVCEEGWILDMPAYTSAFFAPPPMDVVVMGIMNDKFYDLEAKFLAKFIKVLDLLSNDSKSLKRLISLLFDKVLQGKKRGSNDLLFTYERMWALTVYVFLLHQSNQTHFNKLGTEQIPLLYKVLKFKNLASAEGKVRLLMSNLLQYFVKIDCLFYSKEQRIMWTSFERVYFNSNNLLTSIDAIYFRILLRLAQYISKKSSKVESSCDNLEIVVEEIDTELNILSRNVKNSLQNEKMKSFEHNKRAEVTIGSLLSFVSRLQEVVYSQLPDLCLSCKFKFISSRPHYKTRYNNYYTILARSLSKHEQLSITDFRNLARFLFFEQDQVIESFVKEIEANVITKNSCTQGSRLNLHCIHSLKIKFVDFKLPATVSTIYEDIFEQFPEIGDKLLTKTQAFSTVSFWFQKITNQYVIDEHWSLFVNAMIESLWTLYRWDRDMKLKLKKDFQNLFLTLSGTPSFLNYIPLDMRKCIHKINPKLVIHQEELQQDQDDEEFSGAEVRRAYSTYSDQDFYSRLVPKAVPKTQSKPSPKRWTPLEQQRECVICTQQNAGLYQFCYVSQTQFPPVFGITKGQKVLAFTSCHHYCHPSCSSKLRAKNKPEMTCPECKSPFNTFLPSLRIIDPIEEYKEFQQIFTNQMFKKIAQVTSPLKEVVGARIFKSILAFLTLLLSASDLRETLNGSLQIYKCLFRILKKELAISRKQLNYFKQSHLTYMVNVSQASQQNRNTVLHLFQALVTNLNATIKCKDYKQIARTIPPEKIEILADIFQSLLSQKSEITLPIRQEGQKQLQLKPISNKLSDLQSYHSGQCQCSKNERNVFYLCLLHHHKDSMGKYCDYCYLPSINKHIAEYHGAGDALCVRTDNGEIYYFITEGQTMRQLTLPSLYANTIGDKFQSGKLKEKNRFILSQEEYRKLACNFYNRRFIISSKLVEVKPF